MAWRFTRALVRIAANIAYEDAQAAIDGKLAGEPFANELTETALEAPLGLLEGAVAAPAMRAIRSISTCPNGG